MYKNKVFSYEYLILYILSFMVHIYSPALCDHSFKWVDVRIAAFKNKVTYFCIGIHYDNSKLV